MSHEDPRLLGGLYALARSQARHAFSFTSGDRTSQPSSGPFPIAPEGKSNHEIYSTGRGPYDEAVDVYVDGVPIARSPVAALLARFGLHTPVGGDPVHVTLLGVSG